MSTSGTQKTEKKAVKKFNCLLLTISLVLYTVAFVLGAFSGRGERISVIRAVEKIMKIFSFNIRMWDYYLANLAQGIMYIVIMIALIKSCIFGLKYLLWKKSTKYSQSEMLSNEFATVYHKCLLYVLISCMLNQVDLGGSISVLLALGWVIIVISGALENFSSSANISWEYLISDALYALFKGIVFAIFGYCAARPVLSGVINGVRVLFRAVDFSYGLVALDLIYRTLLIEIIHIVLIFEFLKIIEKELFLTKEYVKKGWSRLIVVASVYIAIELFMAIAISSGSANVGLVEQLGEYFALVRNTSLPLLLAAIAGSVSCEFPEFPMLKQKKAVVVEKETVKVASTEGVDSQSEGETEFAE